MLTRFKEKLKIEGQVYLRIKVRPGADKNEIKKIMADETIKIDIAAPALKGRANEALIEFLAEEFKVGENRIKILSGAGDKLKLIKIES